MSALTLLARTTRRSVHTPSGFVRCVATSSPNLPPPAGPRPPHLLTLADLNVQQIQTLITSACEFKAAVKAEAIPVSARAKDGSSTKGALKPVVKTLENKTVALIFNKRSTRTRVATETSVKLLGASSLVLAAIAD
jgi:ornithine carbamoyltransferase